MKTTGLFCLILIFATSCLNKSTPTPLATELVESSIFLEHCLSRLHIEEQRPQETCERLKHHLFQDAQALAQNISPQQVGAPAFVSDAQTQFWVVQDPFWAMAWGYCYFQYKGWFDPEEFSRDDFAMKAVGYAVPLSDMSSYRQWMNSSDGKNCESQNRQRLEQNLNAAMPHPWGLDQIFSRKKALVVLNPVAALNVTLGFDDVMRDLWLTMNHERVHVLQELCPAFKEKSQQAWLGLGEDERDQLQQEHPYYEWQDAQVALREYFAFLNEAHPHNVIRASVQCAF